jgi:hypothetical protein
MDHTQHLRERAARCLKRAEELRRDAETLKRFAEDLAAMARIRESSGAAVLGIEVARVIEAAGAGSCAAGGPVPVAG